MEQKSMLKRLMNTSEYKTSKIIYKVISDSTYRLQMQVPLKTALDSSHRNFTKQEKIYINTSSFDFVIYNKDSFPSLVIEFDGPTHSLYETKRLSDIKKNRICNKAQLPLLRIEDEYLDEYDKTSLLEYIIKRYIYWEKEQPLINKKINKYLSSCSEDEIEYLFQDGFADPTADPTFLFDIRHPFPGTKIITERLKNLGMYNSLLHKQRFSPLQF